LIAPAPVVLARDQLPLDGEEIPIRFDCALRCRLTADRILVVAAKG
jgi:hypothetical protein